MIDLIELKERIDKECGSDISTKSRVRNIIYYKKIFCKIGRLANYSLMQIGDVINIDHPTVLWHSNTIDVVHDKHKLFFNELLDLYGLEFTMPLNIKYRLKDETKLDYAKGLLTKLSQSDLDTFIDTRIIPFLKINKYKYQDLENN